mmetsp:Transcript_86593/g.229523  ORF Transcript_86593/g.229523 Transcript_86593/m.229523 type:complete len:242 (-) Transcript_86593:337-1062(-)
MSGDGRAGSQSRKGNKPGNYTCQDELRLLAAVARHRTRSCTDTVRRLLPQIRKIGWRPKLPDVDAASTAVACRAPVGQPKQTNERVAGMSATRWREPGRRLQRLCTRTSGDETGGEREEDVEQKQQPDTVLQTVKMNEFLERVAGNCGAGIGGRREALPPRSEAALALSGEAAALGGAWRSAGGARAQPKAAPDLMGTTGVSVGTTCICLGTTVAFAGVTLDRVYALDGECLAASSPMSSV